jgi:hypothetical protein
MISISYLAATVCGPKSVQYRIGSLARFRQCAALATTAYAAEGGYAHSAIRNEFSGMPQASAPSIKRNCAFNIQMALSSPLL